MPLNGRRFVAEAIDRRLLGSNFSAGGNPGDMGGLMSRFSPSR